MCHHLRLALRQMQGLRMMQSLTSSLLTQLVGGELHFDTPMQITNSGVLLRLVNTPATMVLAHTGSPQKLDSFLLSVLVMALAQVAVQLLTLLPGQLV